MIKRKEKIVNIIEFDWKTVLLAFILGFGLGILVTQMLTDYRFQFELKKIEQIYFTPKKIIV